MSVSQQINHNNTTKHRNEAMNEEKKREREIEGESEREPERVIKYSEK